MIEMEREIQTMGEKYRAMEVCVAGWMDGWMDGTVVIHMFAWLTPCSVQIEVKEARDVMVEANTQEYAFNFLQQSLQNKIQDAEVDWVTQQTLKSRARMDRWMWRLILIETLETLRGQ